MSQQTNRQHRGDRLVAFGLVLIFLGIAIFCDSSSVPEAGCADYAFPLLTVK